MNPTNRELVTQAIALLQRALQNEDFSAAAPGVTPPAPAAAAPGEPTHPCPAHPDRDWTLGKYGWFCTGKGLQGYRIDKRGYCGERP